MRQQRRSKPYAHFLFVKYDIFSIWKHSDHAVSRDCSHHMLRSSNVTLCPSCTIKSQIVSATASLWSAYSASTEKLLMTAYSSSKIRFPGTPLHTDSMMSRYRHRCKVRAFSNHTMPLKQAKQPNYIVIFTVVCIQQLQKLLRRRKKVHDPGEIKACVMTGSRFEKLNFDLALFSALHRRGILFSDFCGRLYSGSSLPINDFAQGIAAFFLGSKLCLFAK